MELNIYKTKVYETSISTEYFLYFCSMDIENIYSNKCFQIILLEVELNIKQDAVNESNHASMILHTSHEV